jgi:hypothetical protein
VWAEDVTDAEAREQEALMPVPSGRQSAAILVGVCTEMSRLSNEVVRLRSELFEAHAELLAVRLRDSL